MQGYTAYRIFCEVGQGLSDTRVRISDDGSRVCGASASTGKEVWLSGVFLRRAQKGMEIDAMRILHRGAA